KWAADHIRHHANCDQEADPYNAQRGFWYSHCGWLFFKDTYADEKYASRLRQDPVVMWQHRNYLPIVLAGLALTFVVGFLHNGWAGGLGCFLLAGVGRTFAVLNSTFCINSVCHLWGRQPHGLADSSQDSWWVSLITFGEGYHNYHHTYQSDYRNGPRWYNFDPSKWLIFTLSRFGLASSLRTTRTDLRIKFSSNAAQLISERCYQGEPFRDVVRLDVPFPSCSASVDSPSDNRSST